MPSDPQIWQEAKRRLPLPMLLTKIGDGAFTVKGAPCPFCEKKGGWSVYKQHDKHYFKCFKDDCAANHPEGGHGEIGYLALRKGISIKDASTLFLELAGVKPPPEIIPFRPPSDKAPPTEPQNVWHALWQKLPLTGPDRALLRKQRGFSDETITTLGFRSNQFAHRAIIETLEEKYSIEHLVSEGIYKAERRAKPSPAGQLYGYGITDRKDKEGKNVFALTEPIIIPYLDEDGIPFYLRPHKGGVTKPKDELEEIVLHEDDEEHRPCSSHVYCPFLLAELIDRSDGLCVLTEGEFKADALYQCGIAALGCPGITFIRNRAFRDELLGILKKFRVTDMVIVYDNEVKNDPAFKNRYKPDPWKQWDTQVWAEYAARALRDHFRSAGGTCRVGNLPDYLRVDGKADFDGVLAAFVHGVENHAYFVRPLGIEEGTAAARRAFLRVIEEASDHPAVELFPSVARRIIECKVERLYYKPLVFFGGERELTLAARFSEFDPDSQGRVDDQLAQLYRSLRGCYYERKRAKDKIIDSLMASKNVLEKRLEELKEHASENQNKIRLLYARLAAVWERIKGIPEPISNFTLICDYKLHTGAGSVDRLVRVKDAKQNGSGPNTLRRVTAKELARTAEFREWCLSTGEGVWSGGEIALQHLTQDMDHHSYLRDIHEVNTYGFHKESGIWFFGDCAFPPGEDGAYILADKSNIFWHNGVGYQVTSSTDSNVNAFCQTAPLLFSPNGPAADIPAAFLTEGKPDVSKIFSQFSRDMFDTIGDPDGWTLIGLVLAYAIAPELCRAGGHPSAWLTGKLSSGKTSIGRWNMRVWGFPDLGGIKLGEKSTSAVGVNRGLTQYSALPLLLDEYRRTTIDPEKEEVLRGAFDRSGGLKGIADGSNKTRNPMALTTPLVMGESSSSDPATRSRYAQIHVAIQKRIGDGSARYNRVQEECAHYYLIAQWLMRHRKKFAEDAMSFLQTWKRSPITREKIANDRVRHVYGTALACYRTAAVMLRTLKPADEADFQQFILDHGEIGLADVIEETWIAQFWQDVITARQRNKVDSKFFCLRYVSTDPSGVLTETNANHPEAIHVCYLASHPIFAAYQQEKRTRGEQEQLSYNDLRRELEKENYWMPNPKREGARAHRIFMGGTRTTCWVINLDRLTNQGPEETWPYLFPYAEDLINVLSPVKTTEDY